MRTSWKKTSKAHYSLPRQNLDKEVDRSMLRKLDCLDARVCVFRVNAVKAEKGREGRAEDVAAACGLRHVTVFFLPKKK